jgi:lipopolysaccharide/colanic/teichoic acid biosynthesis glycosyltransferase
MTPGNQIKPGFYERVVKRAFDIVLSIAALIILSPVTLLCAIAIKLDDVHGHVLFTQPRNGRYGEVFRVIKFRTMKRELSDGNVWATPSTLTKAGRIIRLLSLDEIPQFLTILTGKMSFIGPRPLLLSYYEWFNETERRRFNVRPGLTGLSQINGRANLDWDKRFALDVEYADNISFWLDAKIFFKTFGVILSHKDVIPEGEVPLEDFSEYRRNQLRKKKGTVVRLNTQPPENAYTSKSMQA